MQHQYLYDGMGNQVQDVATTSARMTTTYHIYDGHNVQLAKYQKCYLYGSDKLVTLLVREYFADARARRLKRPFPIVSDPPDERKVLKKE